MAQLAIKGHATRSKEVIEILEMLGGKNDNHCCGGFISRIYFINENGYIEGIDKMHHLDYFQLSLEEFLEKFPYKVGDKVLYKHDNKIFFIRKMFLENDKILYELSDEVYSGGCSIPDTIIFDVDVVKLQPYKEETMEETLEQITLDIPDGYEFFGINDDNQVVLAKIQPQYPKTYVECAKTLNCFCAVNIDGYKGELLDKLQELIICRDAYWKITGDWKPDYMYGDLYCIGYDGNVVTWKMQGGCRLLAFPTEEMRDAFYENFKELIELVKELL